MYISDFTSHEETRYAFVRERLTHVDATVKEPPVKPDASAVKKRPLSGYGGYRPGGGRPRKDAPPPNKESALPAFPPLQAGYARPGKFFEYWKSLTQTQVGTISVYVNRSFPLCNPKAVNPDAVKYIELFTGPCPCEPVEYKDFMLRKFGSGDYTIYFNEGTMNRFRILIEGLRDYDNFPPLIDWDTLMVGDKANKDFVKWARTHGYADQIRRLEGDSTPEGQQKKEDGEVNAAIIEQNTTLTGKLVDMAERVAEARHTPQPVPQRNESPEQKKSLEMIDKAGDAAFRMIEKAIDLSTSRSSDAADPMTQVRSIVELTRSLAPTADNTANTMLSEALRETRAELREMRQLHAAYVPKPEPSLVDRLAEMKQIRELLKDGSDEDKDDGPKPGSAKAMLLQMAINKGPEILGVLLNGISNMAYAYKLATSRPGDPVPPPPAPAPTPPQQQPPPGNQQVPGLSAATQQENEMQFMLRVITPAIEKHLNEWEDRDSPGADFADWFINSQIRGRLAYDELRAIAPDALMGFLGTHPPLARLMTGNPERFSEFVQQFLTRDTIRATQEAEDE